MALKLMDPVYTQMPFFQPNQVLTYNHLNDVAGYLYQQERYTRNKLIGTGIVCGLSFSWHAAGVNAQVIIDEGCAVTSAGYLIVFKQPVTAAGALVPYTHRRNFTRLKDVEPFKSVTGIATKTVYELITLDQYNAETDAALSKNFLGFSDKINPDKVLILLFDLQTIKVAKCLDESCDDKGKIYDFTPRPLLVPIDVINSILTANSTKSFFTEPGRSYKGKESILFELSFLNLKNLFKLNNLQNVNTPADLVNIFKAPCLDPDLMTIQNAMDALIIKFPWIFDTQLNCMKEEVPILDGPAQSLGTLFLSKAQTFRNSAANNNYMQYLYNFLRDVVDAYNELFSSVTDLVGECGGNEFMHPFHIMLGLPQSNDTLACYKEEKFTEHNHKYRNYFVPSPVMDGQFMLYEKVQSQFKRLIRIVANFNVNISDTTIKVIAGKDYDWLLGDRVLPYFYLQANIDKIKGVWNYDASRRNKIAHIKGYQLAFTQDQLLDEDTSKNNFYRIEGHIGSTGAAAIAAIDILRNKYNLPFEVSSISVQPKTNTISCAFPDLDEAYNYYRDRVLGYIREIERWLEDEVSKDALSKNVTLKSLHEIIYPAIKKMKELLAVRCVKDFDYNKYKEFITVIWNAFFNLYTNLQSNNVTNANQALNSVINIFNIIFFRPIYKIWYMYKYRVDVLAQTSVNNLKMLSAKTTGLEHLAGVRRGETFLLVTDQLQDDKVIADFSLPDLPGCGCDCKPEPCDGQKKALVSPLQKPVIMVVDYNFNEKKSLAKTKAYYNDAAKMYVLELDSMGFYKADSTIDNPINVYDAQGKPFDSIIGSWENEKFILRYKVSDNAKNDGVFKLFYDLTGNFDGSKVTGELFLFVIGRVRGNANAGTYTVVVGTKATEYYPYDKIEMANIKPYMKFDGATKRRTIGETSVDVYTTANGNELVIFKNKKGLHYLQMINAKKTGVENVPIRIESGNASAKATVQVNVIDRKEKLANEVVSGIIKFDDGTPMKDARVRVGNKEVMTNEKGEYTLEGIKSGDVIEVEKAGYKVTALQANSKLNPNIKLEKSVFIDLSGLEKLNLPGDIGNFAEGINISALRNIMK